jgi:hypothetical protein
MLILFVLSVISSRFVAMTLFFPITIIMILLLYQIIMLGMFIVNKIYLPFRGVLDTVFMIILSFINCAVQAN